MRKLIFVYDYADHRHSQALVVSADTGHVERAVVATYAETGRPARPPETISRRR